METNTTAALTVKANPYALVVEDSKGIEHTKMGAASLRKLGREQYGLKGRELTAFVNGAMRENTPKAVVTMNAIMASGGSVAIRDHHVTAKGDQKFLFEAIIPAQNAEEIRKARIDALLAKAMTEGLSDAEKAEAAALLK